MTKHLFPLWRRYVCRLRRLHRRRERPTPTVGVDICSGEGARLRLCLVAGVTVQHPASLLLFLPLFTGSRLAVVSSRGPPSSSSSSSYRSFVRRIVNLSGKYYAERTSRRASLLARCTAAAAAPSEVARARVFFIFFFFVPLPFESASFLSSRVARLNWRTSRAPAARRDATDVATSRRFPPYVGRGFRATPTQR